MDRWTDRVVLVTGASSGIGKATVAELSKYPLKIVAVARRITLIQVVDHHKSFALQYLQTITFNVYRGGAQDIVFNCIVYGKVAIYFFWVPTSNAQENLENWELVANVPITKGI